MVAPEVGVTVTPQRFAMQPWFFRAVEEKGIPSLSPPFLFSDSSEKLSQPAYVN